MQRKTVLFCDSDRTRHLVRHLDSHLDPHVLVVCFKRCSVRQRQPAATRRHALYGEAEREGLRPRTRRSSASTRRATADADRCPSRTSRCPRARSAR